MLNIRYHTSFKKDYKRIVKRGYDIKLMEEIIQKPAKGEQLPEKNRRHLENKNSRCFLLYKNLMCFFSLACKALILHMINMNEIQPGRIET